MYGWIALGALGKREGTDGQADRSHGSRSDV